MNKKAIRASDIVVFYHLCSENIFYFDVLGKRKNCNVRSKNQRFNETVPYKKTGILA